MALKIKATPKLNKKDSENFIKRVEAKSAVPSHPIPTPKLARFAAKLMKHANSVPSKSHK